MRVKTIAALGAYPQANSNAFVDNLGTLAGVYRTPAIHADVTAVFTNTNPMRPYRGNGRPEVAYVIERMVDEAAAELGIDPVELRRRNMIPPEAMPFKSGLTFTYDCGEFAKNLDLALEARRCRRLRERAAPRRAARGKLRGIGLSNTIERAAAGGFEAAEIRFDRGGTVTLLSGSITQGQGHETIYKQLLCDRLGIHPDQVHYVQGDTDKVAIGEGTGGSRSATLGGSAVDLATDKIVAKATAIAAHMLGAEPTRSNSTTASSRRRAPNRTLTIGEIAERIAQPAEPARRHGAGPRRQRHLQPQGAELSRMAAISASSRSTRRPARSRSCATASSTMSAR